MPADDGDTGSPPTARVADIDGGPPSRTARAQRRKTVMPLIWSVLGILIVLVFVAFLAPRFGYGPKPAPASAAAASSALSGPPSSAPAKLR